EVGSPFDTIRDNELIRDELLRHVMGVWDHLKNHCPQHKDQLATWALDWIGMVPGKRESRRLRGPHILNENELRAGQLFSDRVAYGGHFFDLHTLGGILTARDNQPGNPVDLDPLLWDSCRMNPYSIPLRSLYSNNIRNLFMAGRCISTSHVAFGSVRVMNTGALTGQAAGVASFHCIRSGLTPDQLSESVIQDIQETLLRQDCFIPRRSAQDHTDFAQAAQITASSQMAFSGILPDDGIVDLVARLPDDRQLMKEPFGVLMPNSEKKIETVSIWLESDDHNACEIAITLIQTSHIWDYEGNLPVAERIVVIQPGQNGWLEIPFHVQVEPGRLYWLKTSIVEGHIYWRYVRGLRWPGTLSIWQRRETGLWKHFFGGHKQPFNMLLYKISPANHPFAPTNVLSGVTRPEEFTNIWISDPSQAFPQWLELCWPEKHIIHCVEITFDTDLSLTNETVAAPYDYPTLVKTYSLQIPDGSGGWQSIASRTDNASRKVVHRLEGISTDLLRLFIEATRGDRSARVYEIRTY
ncbi:MAG: FAD-dependent oxidoreductase, partial [Spirochaetota bacterium]